MGFDSGGPFTLVPKVVTRLARSSESRSSKYSGPRWVGEGLLRELRREAV